MSNRWDDPKYKNQAPRDSYWAEGTRIRSLVRSELEEENLDPRVPKSLRDMIWEKAWSDGHTDGYSSVASHYEGLALIVETAYLRGIADVKADLNLDEPTPAAPEALHLPSWAR